MRGRGQAVCAAALALALASGVALAAPRRAGESSTRATSTPRATIVSPAQMHDELAKRRGQVVFLHLWATWCLPCLDELPVVGRFARDMKGKGVDVLSVSLDEPNLKNAERVSRLLAEKAAGALTSVIVKVDDADAFIERIDRSWDGNIPAVFVYGRDGTLHRAHVGLADRVLLDALAADARGDAVPNPYLRPAPSGARR